jgi:hypothetical protein
MRKTIKYFCLETGKLMMIKNGVNWEKMEQNEWGNILHYINPFNDKKILN